MKFQFPITLCLLLIWGGTANTLAQQSPPSEPHIAEDSPDAAASAEWPAGVPGLRELREEVEQSDYPFSLYPIYSWMPRDAWEVRGLDTLYWRELAKYGRAQQLAVQRRLALAEQSARYLTSMIALGQNTWLFSDARDEVRPNGIWLRMLIHGNEDAGVKDLFLQIKLNEGAKPTGRIFHGGAGVIEQAAQERIVIADGIRELSASDFPKGFDTETLREKLRGCDVSELPERDNRKAPEDAAEVSLEIVVPGAHRLVNFALVPQPAEDRAGEEDQEMASYRKLVNWLRDLEFQAD